MKRIIALLMTTLLLLGSAPASSAAETSRQDLYDLTKQGNMATFVNYVDGYSLQVDGDMKADMTDSDVVAVLENSSKRIEIFRQPLSGVGRAGYMNYSNRFTENTADHRIEYQGYQTIAGRQVHLVSWNRDKLSRVRNDKNFYLVMDLVEGNTAYTIFVKANQPISNLGGYATLIQDFKTFQPTKSAVHRKTTATDPETRGWNPETLEYYTRYFAEEAPLTWGIFEPTTAMFDYKTLDYFENYIGYQFPIILNYSEFENTYKHPNLTERLDTAWKHGKVLELTLQTNWKAAGTGNMVYDVLQGEYDSFLKDYAGVIADFDHPVLFRLGNEMNGDWCPYSSYHTSRDPMIFKEWYRYVYQIFEEAGADNVIWVWNPNGESFPDFRWNHTMMYYPGDEYVDVVGLTAYNTGTYYAATGEKWQTFDELYDWLYRDYVNRFSQPLMITEFASANTGGDKTQWVDNMFRSFRKYPGIKVALWWDGADKDAYGNIARSYYIDEPKSVLDVFRKHLRDTWKFNSLG